MLQTTLRPNRAAVAGILAVGTALAISSFSVSVARAEHVKPDKSKVFSCSSGLACVAGKVSGSSLTLGVYGSSAIGYGVYGTSSLSTGVYGTSSSSYGVFGNSSSGKGVYGISSSSTGVEGHSTGQVGTGVAGYGELGEASGGNGTGVYGNGYYGVTGEGSFVGVSSQADGYYSYIFMGYNTATGAECTIDYQGNLMCTGSITGGAHVRVRQVNSSGQHVLAYAPESASATIDDVGTARMIGGVANVAIERAFGSTIDRNSPYHVFLTPMGDTRGLYVSAKTSTGFEVRETQGGRSTLSFDYRIVARPLGAENDRLPLTPAMKKPPPVHHG